MQLRIADQHAEDLRVKKRQSLVRRDEIADTSTIIFSVTPWPSEERYPMQPADFAWGSAKQGVLLEQIKGA
jgi:hypothetical protein